ncbi:hypothetical protein V6251_11940 [Olleya sp. Ti.3.14]|uniref:hypothetical protein n=1 Tax=Olleya sp. Ti.3.14 TaxID=3121297 RepID=UPI00311FD152
MKKTIIILFLLLAITACKNNTNQPQSPTETPSDYQQIITTHYQLYKPTQKAKAVLILFGGFPEQAEDIKKEFKILEHAKKNNIAVLLSNYNQKLWLDTQDKQQLTTRLQNAITDNQLPTDAIYIGGFSSGGVVSLLLSDFVAASKQYNFNPKGVFIVDSPIDLEALYKASQKNLERQFSEVSVEESTWIQNTLTEAFGPPETNLDHYQNNSVYTYSSNYTKNLQHLKNTKIRLYTEPDTLWWKTNRKADYDQMNAYYIKKLAEQLQAQQFKNVQYIPTRNKGYRSNGDRHPHSWSIIDVEDLVAWILND